MALKPYHLIFFLFLIGCGKTPEQYYEEGKKSYDNGEIEKAIESLDKAIESEDEWSKKEVFIEKRAEAYLDLEQTNLALTDYLNIIRNADFQNHGDLGYYYNEIGNCYSALDSTRDAIKYYKKAIDIYPKDTIVLLNLADLYYENEQFKNAEKFYSDVLALGYRDSTILYSRSQSYNALSKFDKSLSDLQNHLNLFGKSSKLLLQLGDVYSFLEQYEKAIDNYNEALAIGTPNVVDILISRANSYFYLKEIEKAKSDLNLALSVDSSDAEIHYQLGFIFYDSDEFEQAIGHLSKAIQLGDSTVETFFTRGDAYMRMSLKDEACDDLNYAANLEDEEAIQMVQDLCN